MFLCQSLQNFCPIYLKMLDKVILLTIKTSNHMTQWNLFDVVNSVILKFPAVLKFPADDL